jgi:hypothetical protein
MKKFITKHYELIITLVVLVSLLSPPGYLGA